MSGPEIRDVFGCDIGSKNGYISVLQNVREDPVSMFPKKYQLEEVGMLTSAYIAPPDGETIEVFDGRAAYDKYVRESDKFIHAVKTRLREGSIPVPGIRKPVNIDRVYAAITRDLIRLGNEERRSRGQDPIYEIVFTFPAAFTDDLTVLNRMQKSIEDLVIDGHKIKVVGRLPEPGAVAVDYLYYMQNLAPAEIRIDKDSYTVLVYDLGHGTFDVAVVTARSSGEPYQLHINDGLPDVGGKDFDNIIYDEIIRILKADYGYTPTNANARDVIRRGAISLKHELSIQKTGTFEMTLPGGDEAAAEISKEWFEKKSEALINQTFELAARILQQAEDENIHVDAVVLSGGASEMPMVEAGLRKLLEGDDIALIRHRPSKAVSYGAARYAYGRSASDIRNDKTDKKDKPDKKIKPEGVVIPPILEKFTEYSYGIWVPSDEELAGEVKVMVDSRKRMPARSQTVTLVSADSPMRIRLYRSREKHMDKPVLNTGEEVESIMFIPFDVPADTECQVGVEVLEDHNIKVTCKPVNADTMEKTTMDSFL